MNKNVRIMSYSAISAAIIFIVTWQIKLNVPGTAGAYIHLGDSMIYLSAYLLGGPIAALAAGIGSAFADLAGGYVVYIPATIIIKGVMGLLAGYMLKKKSFPLYVITCVLGGAIMTVGYALYETAVFGFAYAMTALPFNMIQWLGGIVIAIILYPVAQRIQKVFHFNELQR